MKKLKALAAWLASHWTMFTLLFPIYFSKSWYFRNHHYVVSVRFDSNRLVRARLGGEWFPADTQQKGSSSWDVEFVFGPAYLYFGTVL